MARPFGFTPLAVGSLPAFSLHARGWPNRLTASTRADTLCAAVPSFSNRSSPVPAGRPLLPQKSYQGHLTIPAKGHCPLRLGRALLDDARSSRDVVVEPMVLDLDTHLAGIRRHQPPRWCSLLGRSSSRFADRAGVRTTFS